MIKLAISACRDALLDNLKLLQALAALGALVTASYTLFLREYLTAPPPSLATGYASVPCKELVAIEGDAVRCDGAAMRLLGDGSPYKLGISAPKVTRPRCEKERELGQRALDRLAELIKDVHHVEDSGASDTSGRKFVKVRLPGGRTAGAVLVDEGLAHVWFPGYKSTWCD